MGINNHELSPTPEATWHPVNLPKKVDQSDSFLPTTELAYEK